MYTFLINKYVFSSEVSTPFQRKLKFKYYYLKC